jgi:hypothetical protein
VKTTAQKLLEITPSVSDRQVAMMLADKCIELTDAPFRFAINHDIRPPKNLACPLEYGWTRKDRCGVEWKNRAEIRQWLTKAFLLGYTVQQTNERREGIGYTHSIAIIRRRAENHQRPINYDSDDIPF